MLAPALRGHIDHGSFENLQQGLLHAFARNVTRDRRVVALAGDLVDLVDEDDATFGLLDVVVGDLQQPRKDALDVLAHVTRLGQHRGVHDGEGHLQQFGDRAGHQRLARTRGSHQHDVRLVDLHLVLLGGVEQPLVVVVNGHGHITLGVVLTDDVLVEEILDLGRLEQLLHLERRSGCAAAALRSHVVLDDDPVAVFDTFVADVGAVDALKHDLHVAALGAAERAAVAARPVLMVVAFSRCHYFPRLDNTSSISPYSLASRAESQ